MPTKRQIHNELRQTEARLHYAEKQVKDLAPKEGKLKEGIIVMLDALGFKGIWTREDPEAVLAKMVALHESAQKRADEDAAAKQEHFMWKLAYLSDTIVIGVWPGPHLNVPMMLAFAATVVLGTIQNAVMKPPALAYRGVICRGKFEMEKSFFIGPAVDEASRYMELADGAFVWAAPSALSSVSATFPQSFLQPYTVPLKDGRSFQTKVVLPFFFGDALERKQEVRDRMLATFDKDAERDVTIAVKRQNTADFLNEMIRRGHPGAST